MRAAKECARQKNVRGKRMFAAKECARQKNLLCKQMCAQLTNVSNKCARSSNGTIPLHYAAMNGSLETCMLLWEHLKEKNVPNANGLTPLHYAATLIQ